MKYVILVGTDYSEASDLALGQALELAASRPNAELHVVNVWLPDIDAIRGAAIDSSSPSLQRAAADLSAYITHQVAAFEKRGDVGPVGKVHAHVRVADPGREIAQLAADLEADLV